MSVNDQTPIKQLYPRSSSLGYYTLTRTGRERLIFVFELYVALAVSFDHIDANRFMYHDESCCR